MEISFSSFHLTLTPPFEYLHPLTILINFWAPNALHVDVINTWLQFWSVVNMLTINQATYTYWRSPSLFNQILLYLIITCYNKPQHCVTVIFIANLFVLITHVFWRYLPPAWKMTVKNVTIHALTTTTRHWIDCIDCITCSQQW